MLFQRCGRWAQQRFRQCLAFLVQWAESAGNVGRFPQTCQAILNVWEAFCQEGSFNQTDLKPAAVIRDGTKKRFHLGSLTLAHNSGIYIDDRRRADNRDRKWRSRKNNKIRQLEDQLKTLREKHETSKTVGGILSMEWVLRVIVFCQHLRSRITGDLQRGRGL